MLHHKFTTFVYSPAQFSGGELAIAAMRGGSVGIINAELEEDIDNTLICLDSLERYGKNASGQYGLKLSTIDQKILDRLAPYLKSGLAWLIVDSNVLDAFFASTKFKKINVPNLLVECITGDIPDCVKKGCVDGVVIKGNESGGYIGEESSFILLQKWAQQTDIPLYIRGGITPHVAVACYTMGVAGGVLDSQVLLLDESPAAPYLQKLFGTLSGGETVAVGDNEKSFYFRVLNHPQLKTAKAFIAEGENCSPDTLRKLIANYSINWMEPKQSLIPVGHDCCGSVASN